MKYLFSIVSFTVILFTLPVSAQEERHDSYVTLDDASGETRGDCEIGITEAQSTEYAGAMATSLGVLGRLYQCLEDDAISSDQRTAAEIAQKRVAIKGLEHIEKNFQKAPKVNLFSYMINLSFMDRYCEILNIDYEPRVKAQVKKLCQQHGKFPTEFVSMDQYSRHCAIALDQPVPEESYHFDNRDKCTIGLEAAKESEWRGFSYYLDTLYSLEDCLKMDGITTKTTVSAEIAIDELIDRTIFQLEEYILAVPKTTLSGYFDTVNRLSDLYERADESFRPKVISAVNNVCEQYGEQPKEYVFMETYTKYCDITAQ